MIPFQLEYREIVIKLGRRPRLGGMAGTAIVTETPLVRFLRPVAGIAILRRFLEIGKRSRIEMTLRADYSNMFTGQLEDKVMFEIFTKPIHAVVAIEAGITICQGMCQGEG